MKKGKHNNYNESGWTLELIVAGVMLTAALCWPWIIYIMFAG